MLNAPSFAFRYYTDSVANIGITRYAVTWYYILKMYALSVHKVLKDTLPP